MLESQKVDDLLEHMLLISGKENSYPEDFNLMVQLNEQLQKELNILFSLSTKFTDEDKEKIQYWSDTIEKLKLFNLDARKKVASEVSNLRKGQKGIQKYLLNK